MGDQTANITNEAMMPSFKEGLGTSWEEEETKRKMKTIAETDTLPKQSLVDRTDKKTKRINFLTLLFTLFFITNLLAVFLLKKEKDDYFSLKAKASTYANLKEEEINSLLAQSEKLNQAFLNQNGVIDFIENLEKYKGSFTTFGIVFEKDQPQGSEVKYLPFTLKASGSYSLLASLLKQLLKVPLVFEIRTLEYTSKDDFLQKAEMVISGNLYVAERF